MPQGLIWRLSASRKRYRRPDMQSRSCPSRSTTAQGKTASRSGGPAWTRTASTSLRYRSGRRYPSTRMRTRPSPTACSCGSASIRSTSSTSPTGEGTVTTRCSRNARGWPSPKRYFASGQMVPRFGRSRSGLHPRGPLRISPQTSWNAKVWRSPTPSSARATTSSLGWMRKGGVCLTTPLSAAPCFHTSYGVRRPGAASRSERSFSWRTSSARGT